MFGSQGYQRHPRDRVAPPPGFAAPGRWRGPGRRRLVWPHRSPRCRPAAPGAALGLERRRRGSRCRPGSQGTPEVCGVSQPGGAAQRGRVAELWSPAGASPRLQPGSGVTAHRGGGGSAVGVPRPPGRAQPGSSAGRGRIRPRAPPSGGSSCCSPGGFA